MHRLPIDERKIKELARQARHCNVSPIFLTNEYFREDEKHPVHRLLKEVVPEVSDYLAAITDIEFRQLIDAMALGFKIMVGRDVERATQEQRERVALYYLGSEIQRIQFPFSEMISARVEDSEVLKMYPELLPLLDKDGLLQIDDRFKLHDGGVEYKDHMLHYHQFLRRGFTSNPNFDFLLVFSNFYRHTKMKNKFRIAVDHQRIMPLAAYKSIVELDTWYGPGFDRDKLDDSSSLGLTIVKRNTDSLFGLTNDLERTEFYWSYRDGVKTLEIEEVSNVGHYFEQFHLNRYLHAERDIEGKILRHVDGSVKVYLRNDYDHRLASQMPVEAKSHRKVKVWRVDGDLDVDIWLHLTALFFKGNEMIIEYFDPAKFEEVFAGRLRVRPEE